jgi:hypothetical protein
MKRRAEGVGRSNSFAQLKPKACAVNSCEIVRRNDNWPVKLKALDILDWGGLLSPWKAHVLAIERKTEALDALEESNESPATVAYEYPILRVGANGAHLHPRESSPRGRTNILEDTKSPSSRP